ncbi:putative histone-like transcription factor [Heterostelium album PN500]|uniref:Putative histone-like transcription factor n=1 Tax=Heterostelium pallidum (strain ATCC 26659 / Pp 5 / PN500) TaxID=670386 RepID=D3BHV2_HETP5|nr:putative histone-like transcription factor [Heterostelium album PN500]EFA78852.1 putative histone-like transcription factor [Heterostelium album PN500]|eukprot:XP_020430976.1 putative histone-like transcription factor [Heterostelium album PN500]
MADMIKSEKDDNLSLPKATVSKLIKEVLPEGVKCSTETRDLILECCVETRKTIAAEHVIKALNELGFNEYTQKVSEVYDKHKEEASAKPSKSKKFEGNKPPEQLLREQQLLFAQAKSAYQSNNNGGEQQQPPTE